MVDLIAIAETLEAQAGALRREAARLAGEGQTELELSPPLLDAGWTEHDGGECPESAYGKVVNYQERNGSYHSAPSDALIWPHDGDGGDIIRWQISAVQPDE